MMVVMMGLSGHRSLHIFVRHLCFRSKDTQRGGVRPGSRPIGCLLSADPGGRAGRGGRLTSGEGDPPHAAADLRPVFPVPPVTFDTGPGTQTGLQRHQRSKRSRELAAPAETSSAGSVRRDTERRSCRAPGRRAAVCPRQRSSWQPQLPGHLSGPGVSTDNLTKQSERSRQSPTSSERPGLGSGAPWWPRAHVFIKLKSVFKRTNCFRKSLKTR